MLHGIGFFIESLRDSTLPGPQELVVGDSRLQAVADYLDQGLIHERYRGFSWCLVCGQDSALMGSTDLTDGVWLWPAGLSHYLRCHSVGLPESFITHALAKPTFTQPAPNAVTDFGLWIEWARPQRSLSIRDAISLAQLEDDRLAAIARAERVAANLAKFGESEAACIRARLHLYSSDFLNDVRCIIRDIFDNRVYPQPDLNFGPPIPSISAVGNAVSARQRCCADAAGRIWDAYRARMAPHEEHEPLVPKQGPC